MDKPNFYMKKVIAIAFSDLHINDWSKFNANNERTLNHFKVLSLIKEKCIKYRCPALFCGDLLHKPDVISLDLLNLLIDKLKEIDHNHTGEYNFHMLSISGNHDTNKVISVSSGKPVSWLNTLSKDINFLQSIDFQSIQIPHAVVYGVPYIDHNIGLNEYIKNLKLSKNLKNILLLHTDYPGAKDTDGVEVGSVENLNTNLLQKFDLVLIGHIHKPQRLGKKIIMVGAPLQQRRTDKDCELGYWKVYSDMSVKFHPFRGIFPKFIDVEDDKDVKDDGNYYTVVSKPKVIESKENIVTRDLSKKNIVKAYLETKGIKNKTKKHILIKLIKEAEE